MSAPGPTLILLRHGETEWSRTGKHTGRSDIPLTATGEAQAEKAGAYLAGVEVARVMVSPMQRARRTAALAGLTDRDAPEEVDDDLREWDYGEFEGLTSAEIRRLVPGWTVWDGPWRGGEDAEAVARRADRVVAAAVEAPAGARVVLVAHGHILRVIGARWLGAPVRDGRWLALDTAAICELGWEHDARVLHRWNVVPGATMQG